jgi:hypothetical protein
VWCVVKSFLFSAKIKKQFRSIFHTQLLRLAVVEDGAYLAFDAEENGLSADERTFWFCSAE